MNIYCKCLVDTNPHKNTFQMPFSMVLGEFINSDTIHKSRHVMQCRCIGLHCNNPLIHHSLLSNIRLYLFQLLCLSLSLFTSTTMCLLGRETLLASLSLSSKHAHNVKCLLVMALFFCAERERLEQEQEQQRQDCLHLRSRLEIAQSECQREREVREEEGQKGERGIKERDVVCVHVFFV